MRCFGAHKHTAIEYSWIGGYNLLLLATSCENEDLADETIPTQALAWANEVSNASARDSEMQFEISVTILRWQL